MNKPCIRHQLEQKAAKIIVDYFLKKGWSIEVDNGEYIEVKRTTDKNKIVSGMFSTDEDILRVAKDDKKASILLIYGNGPEDIIADYGVSIDDEVTPLMEEIENIDWSE